MPLQASIQSATSQSIGFGTTAAIPQSVAVSFMHSGFSFVVGYLSCDKADAVAGLTTQQIEEILGVGLAVIIIQQPIAGKWSPDQALGARQGASLVAQAGEIGLPNGMQIWLDLDGVDVHALASDVTAYCMAWFDAVSQAKYVPGLKIGGETILTSDQLDALPFEFYWKSAAATTSYPVNGFCLLDSVSTGYVIDGYTYVRSLIQQDNYGNTPFWLIAQKTTPASVISKPEVATPAPVVSKPEVATPAPVVSKSRGARTATVVALASLLSYAAGVATGPLILSVKRGSVKVSEKASEKALPTTTTPTDTSVSKQNSDVAKPRASSPDTVTSPQH